MTQLLESDPAKEVAIFGAVWVSAPFARYVDAVKNIEEFEKGDNFLITKRISSPPQVEDFDRLTLPPEDVADLRACKVGDCELKLGEAALVRIQKTTDWSKPTATADVERQSEGWPSVRHWLSRGRKQPVSDLPGRGPPDLRRSGVRHDGRSHAVLDDLPGSEGYLLDYPKATLPKSELSVLAGSQFGLKPTLRINHLTISDQPTHVAVVSKMLYASHYFWTAIELRILVPRSRAWRRFLVRNVNRADRTGWTDSPARHPRQSARRGREGMQAA